MTIIMRRPKEAKPSVLGPFVVYFARNVRPKISDPDITTKSINLYQSLNHLDYKMVLF